MNYVLYVYYGSILTTIITLFDWVKEIEDVAKLGGTDAHY